MISDLKSLTLFLYVDALNNDCINPYTMPFLSNLTKSYYQSLDNVFGYSFAIQSAMLSGKYPDENNHWMPYYFSEDGSPFFFQVFGKVSRLLQLDKVPKIQFLSLMESRRFFVKKGVPANNVPSGMIGKIGVFPYYYMCELPFFQELGNLLLQKYNVKFTYIGPPEFRIPIYDKLISHINSSTFDNEFILGYDDKLDIYGHGFGPYSQKYQDYVRMLDKRLEKVYNNLKEKFKDKFNFIVFSDHSQCPTTAVINLLHLINKRNLSFGKDYYCFIDATIALFWPTSNASREAIIQSLSTLKSGVLITDELRKKYHIAFKNNMYGDLIFALNPGSIFFPNFFNPFSAMKGLHGFRPEEDVQKTFILSDKPPSYNCTHVKDFRKLAIDLASNM